MDPLFLPELRMEAKGFEASIQNSTVVGLKDVILQNVG
jgi:hypothetical protein